MKKTYLWISLIIAGLVFACGGKSPKQTENTANQDAPPSENTQNDGKIDPFKGFPKDAITANPGDYVLTPSVNWQKDATEKGPEKVTFIFYSQKMAEAGKEYSKIDFISKKGEEIPNYMIIPIKSGQKAKKGDIVLTWWQSGSGMNRAIVTDDANPAEPMVNYIDIDWNNPAKNKDKVGIGQMSEKLKANSFHVIKDMWESGTSVAVKEDTKYTHATVIKVSGDKVLTIGFAGKMKVCKKSDCVPIPVKLNVKAGDAVQVPWVGTFKNSKVQKVDAKNGRVWCDNPFGKDPLIVPFGSVLTGLDVK